MAEPPINVEQKKERKAEEFPEKDAGKKRKVEKAAVDHQILFHVLLPDDGVSEHHWYTAKFNETSSISVNHVCAMPKFIRKYGTPVVVGSSIYYIGGTNFVASSILWAHPIPNHVTDVHLYDTLCPLKEWRRVSSMTAGRSNPGAVSVDGKVYVFGGHCSASEPFGEVYDPSSDTWCALPDPPNGINLPSSFMISSRDTNYIIVHNGYEFCAYHPRSKSWSLRLGENFDIRYPAVFLDNTIYSYDVYSSFHETAQLWAFQLDNRGTSGCVLKKSLVDFDSKIHAPESFLLALKNGNLCLFRHGPLKTWGMWHPGGTFNLQQLKVSTNDTNGLLRAEEDFFGSFSIENCRELLDVLVL